MSEANAILRIEEKLQRLLKQWQLLREENRSLSDTLSRQQAEMTVKNTRITELEDKIALLKIAATAAGGDEQGEDKKILRSRINDYIREIDRCIALLNS